MLEHPVAAGGRIARLAILTAGLALSSVPARAWGPLIHQRVTGEAIDTLPKGLKPFYKAHRLEIPSLALDTPPPEDEAVERRFQIDRLMPFPFADVPHTEAALKMHYPEAADKVGRLPWLIQESYARLVEAFRSGDKVKILTESDVLSGYVSDLHNPLALTENSDGQKTGQHGLWVRFTGKLPESMDKRLSFGGTAARLIDDPKGYVFAMINQVYIWVDNLLYLEELAKRGQGGYTELYYEMLGDKVGPLLKSRLEDATTDVGSFWYTAWTNAGRPDLK